MARNMFDEWLREKFAPKQLQKFENEKAREVSSTRQELAAEIARLESDRDAELKTLTPRVDEAKKRLDAAMAEIQAASNSYGCLRRRRSSVADSIGRKIAAIERRLRESSDPRIEALRRDVLRAQESLTPGGSEASTPTEWGEKRRYFSTGPALEKRVAELVELRNEAEALKISAVDDLDARLGDIRRRLPTEPVKMVEIHA